MKKVSFYLAMVLVSCFLFSCGNINVENSSNNDSTSDRDNSANDISSGNSSENSENNTSSESIILPLSIDISGQKSSIYVGETLEIFYAISPNNCTDKSVFWSSSDTSVASIDDGIITGLKEGSTIIKVETSNNKSSSFKLNVERKIVEANSISLNSNSKDLYVGDTFTLIGTILPENSENKNILWSSSNDLVVKVDNKGLVTAIGVGTALVTAKTSNNISSFCSITVLEDADDRKETLRNGTLIIDKLNISGPNSVGGIDLYFSCINKSDKQIKYVYVTVYPINGVGDQMFSEIGNTSSIRVKFGGDHYISKLETLYEAVECCWYNSNIRDVVLTKLEIEYSDGSISSFNKTDSNYMNGKYWDMQEKQMENGLKYYRTTRYEAGISGAYKDCSELLNIESKIDNLMITSIINDAFSYSTFIHKLKLPSTLLHIEDNAFSKASLESIDIPSSVLQIGCSCFFECKKLETVRFEGENTLIDISSFRGCKYVSLVLKKDNITNIKNKSSFSTYEIKEIIGNIYVNAANYSDYCSLSIFNEMKTSIYIDEGNYYKGGRITYYLNGGNFEGEYPDSYLYGESTIVPKPKQNDKRFLGWFRDAQFTIRLNEYATSTSTLGIGDRGDVSLYAKWENNYSLVDGVLKINGFDTQPEELILPSSVDGEKVIELGSGTISNMSNLKKLVLPDSIEKIDSKAIQNCSNLETIVFSDNVKNVGSDFITNCDKLTNLYIGKNISLFSYSNLDYYKFNCSNVFFNGTVNEWNQLDFCKGYGLNLKFKNIYFLENDEYNECDSINGYDSSIEKIGYRQYGFLFSKLTYIYVNNKVTRIEKNAFAYTNKLTDLKIGTQLEYIGSSAFNGCNSLTEIDYDGSMSQWMNITKEKDWNSSSSIEIIKCSDGCITI